MERRKITELKFALDDDDELVATGGQIALFAGFSKGLCEKIGTGQGMFTRCVGVMKGKIDDENAFCASLEKYCTGQWPAERKNASDDAEAEKALALEHSNAIRGVEIFGTGTHNGDQYTEKDLDDMVAAFGKLDVKPALKVGHTKDKAGAPAYGWVTNLKRVGQKLVADFESMHDSVVGAIRDKRYDRVSSEIYFNLKRGGETFRRALKAVALLGAEVPAVTGLVPLHKVQFTGADASDSAAACDQQLDVEPRAIVATLAARVEGLVNLVKENGMNGKNAEQIKKLKEQMAEFETQLSEQKGKKADDAKVKELEAKAADIATQIKALEEADKEGQENEKLKARVAQLEAEGRARVLKEKQAAITVPAFRPILRGLIEHALEHPEAKVKTYADKDGKQVATERTMLELADSIVAEINAQAEKLFKAYADAGQQMRSDGDEAADPGEEVDRRVKKYRDEHKSVSYEDAMVAVLKADPELGKRYETERGPRQQ